MGPVIIKSLVPWLLSALYAALMVFSWGGLDYFQDIPRIGALICVLLAPLFQLGAQGNLKRGTDSGESLFAFALIAILSIVGIPFFFPYAARHLAPLNLPPLFGYAGLVLFIAGYWIRAVAIRTLKKQFSVYVTVQQDHQLITTGIYAMIRHPVYLGVIISFTGLALVFPSLYGFLFVLIYSMLLTRRMSLEERLLYKHFGSVFEEYESKSYRLIPYFY